MAIEKRDVCVCDVCGHPWLPRNGDKPKRCAGCKSPYWNGTTAKRGRPKSTQTPTQKIAALQKQVSRLKRSPTAA